MNTIGVYSFRAECPDDVDRFMGECLKVGIIVAGKRENMTPLLGADVKVQIHTSATLTMLQEVMRGVEDGHVMLQTLRECPLEDNHLRREYGLE